MKWVRIAATIASCLLLCGAGSADWKYWSVAGNPGMLLQSFFDKNTVKYLPNHHVQVWTKSLDMQALEKHKMTHTEIDQDVQRLAHDYKPELLKIQKLTHEQMMLVVALEADANGAAIPPKAQILWELDCDGNMSRTLSVVSSDALGNIQTSNNESNWTHNPPEGSTLAILAGMVCK